MRAATLGLFLVLFFHLPALAGVLPSEAEAEKLTAAFMTVLKGNDLPAAFAKLRPFMDITDEDFQKGTENSIARHLKATQRFGGTIGYEFIGGKLVGTSLLRLQYLENKEKFALRWTFFFYRTPQGWVLNTFTWDGEMEGYF